ncbi:MAG TPA: copper transporter [Solirubrobacteraceae bacterium]|nr:copper transporter [Solirubrobacteraceae bacterium]
MFDFRYHALSLAAIFIALVVGLLLGVAIGDKELVSGARQELRNSLRADVRQADQERDAANARVREQNRFADAAYPILTGGQLPDARIGLVLLGTDDSAPDIVRDALEPTGAGLAFVAVVRQNIDLETIADRAQGTRYASIERDSALIDDLGKRAGIQMVLGGKLIEQVRSGLLESLSGSLGNLDGVIVMRSANKPADKDAAERLTQLQDGIARGLVQTGVPVVGTERRASEPSSIGWFRDREMSSVDNLDEQAGRAAVVFVLAGSQGAYGRRDSAQALLPPVVGRAR